MNPPLVNWVASLTVIVVAVVTTLVVLTKRKGKIRRYYITTKIIR